MKKILALVLAVCMVLALAACGNRSNDPAASDAKKTFVFGDTTFNAENEEPDINPHRFPYARGGYLRPLHQAFWPRAQDRNASVLSRCSRDHRN